MFTSYHETFLKAEEECNKVGAYLADILDDDENNWIKSVLNVINPKDGTDYWAGGLDADRNKQMQWITGKSYNILCAKIQIEQTLSYFIAYLTYFALSIASSG